MISIPPNPPLKLPAELFKNRQVKPVDRTNEREMPIPEKAHRRDERRLRRERRGDDGRRIKGYEMRSGRDRRKTDRDAPSIEVDV